MTSQPKRAIRVFRVSLNLVFIVIGLAMGIFGLFLDVADIWIRSGVALFGYGWALRHIAFDHALRSLLGVSTLAVIRAAWVSYVAACCVLAIAMVVRRDAIGWLGLAVCVVWVTSWAWNLRQAKALAAVVDRAATL